MNIWRMKLRAGHHGDDMLKLCKERGIVSMTHKPILNTELTSLEPSEVDKGVKTAARSSIWRFAWKIQGGDEIYIGDSLSKKIIAKCYVDCEPGTRAYRYNVFNPIHPPNRPREPWRHEIPVLWENDFSPLSYRDGAPRYVVTPMGTAWKGFSVPEEDDEDTEGGEHHPLLNESPYKRETKASRQNIVRLHTSLSNRFRVWMEMEFGLSHVIQEKCQTDLTFDFLGKASIAELKICYGASTRHAIRAAIGQLFEYNHYPPRPESQLWWLVLDTKPSPSDFKYIAALKQKYGVPLVLGWPKGDQFEVYPSPPNV